VLADSSVGFGLVVSLVLEGLRSVVIFPFSICLLGCNLVRDCVLVHFCSAYSLRNAGADAPASVCDDYD
jgi:hypothetical protein